VWHGTWSLSTPFLRIHLDFRKRKNSFLQTKYQIAHMVFYNTKLLHIIQYRLWLILTVSIYNLVSVDIIHATKMVSRRYTNYTKLCKQERRFFASNLARGLSESWLHLCKCMWKPIPMSVVGRVYMWMRLDPFSSYRVYMWICQHPLAPFIWWPCINN
jgi:hypothetical protein